MSKDKLLKSINKLDVMGDKIKFKQILGELSKNVPDDPVESTKAGDICYVKGGKKFFCTLEEWNDNLGTPIGVVVVPSSHNEDGSSTIMSLCNMSCKTPETGTLAVYDGDDSSDFGMCWGDSSKSVPGITQSTLQPVVDPITGTSAGIISGGNCLFVSDQWFDTSMQQIVSEIMGSNVPTVASIDDKACYLSADGIGASGYFPSPYLADGSKNTTYNVTGTTLEAVDGKADTACIMNVATKYTTGEISYDDHSEGSYPAATACNRFHTKGTDAGNWYLPSVAEIGYIVARFVDINNTLKSLSNAIELGNIVTYGQYGVFNWSSTEFNQGSVWNCLSDYLLCTVYSKFNNYGGRVRAFTQVFGTKIKPKPQPAPKYEYVDLGLPSGKKWMKYNLGATKPEEYGDYYMWGSVTPNTNTPCDWEHTPFNNGSSDFDADYFNAHKSEWLNGDVLKPKYDAAYQATSGVAHMPTQEDFQELVDNTTNEWITNYQGSGVNGRLFTSKTNGNSMFIPASGFRWDSSFENQGDEACVWSSSLHIDTPSGAVNLYFHSDDIDTLTDSGRSSGLAVRGVRN